MSVLVAGSVTVVFGGLLVVNGPAEAGAGNRATICHRTHSHTNPYRRITVAKQSAHDTHAGPVWFSGISTAWGDIIPTGYSPLTSQNYSGDGLTVFNGSTTCKGLTPLQYIQSEVDAGETLSNVLTELDDQGATEDAATLANMSGGTFSTGLNGLSLTDIETSLGVATPAATTQAATTVTASTATLNGTVNAANASPSIAVSFVYGTDPALLAGTTTTAAAPATVSGSADASALLNLSGLTPSTVYYFQILGVFTDTASGATVDYPGAILSFTTDSTATTTTSTTTTSTTTTTTTTAAPTTTTTEAATTTTAPVITTTTTAAPTTTTTEPATTTTTAVTTTTEPATTTTTEPATTTTTEQATTTTTDPATTTTTIVPVTTSTVIAPVALTTPTTSTTSVAAVVTTTTNPTSSAVKDVAATDLNSGTAVGAPAETTTSPTTTTTTTTPRTSSPKVDGLGAGAAVNVLRADGTVITTLRADANGEVVLTGLPVGDYTIQSTDRSGNPVKKMVRVLGREISAEPAELALTGSNPTSMIFAGLGSIGFGFILLGRRRSVKRR